MKINELTENDAEHAQALKDTGFWGSQGAGCIIMSYTTRRFLIAHRSRQVEQPGTWGTWGGAIDARENPKDAVVREVREEAGYSGPLRAVPLYIFQKGTFRYSNFLAIVKDEFEPKLDWESQGFRWCEFGDWPEPMHFGLKALLDDPASLEKMKRACRIDSNERTQEGI